MTLPKQRRTFDLAKTVRALGRWLLAEEGRSAFVPPGDIRGGGKIDEQELAVLFGLAIDHLGQHSIDLPMPDAPAPARCKAWGARCRAHGAAQALYLGLVTLVNAGDYATLVRTRRALMGLSVALGTTRMVLDGYLARCRARHAERWDKLPPAPTPPALVRGLFHDHDAICKRPQQLQEAIATLIESIELTDARSLVPQIERLDMPAQGPAGKRRPVLITRMQAELLQDGWPARDVVKTIDDGRGGTEKQAVDRMRKELAAERRTARSVRPAD